MRETLVACGGIAPADLPALSVALGAVPNDVADYAASVLRPVPAAAALRASAFAWLQEPGKPLSTTLTALAPEALQFATTYDLGPHCLALVDKTDVAALAQAARQIATPVLALRRRHLGASPFHFAWNTALGRVELSGGASDTHRLEGALLVLDTGGDDTYIGGPPGPGGLSIVIDQSGDDHYADCGLATLGVSEIFDFSGNDTYTASGSGNGAAAFGVSLLYDAGGNDAYSCRDLGEGAAVVGIGLLIDLAGDDSYACRSLAQGFGGVRGFGALVDVRGNDHYTADDTHIDNPSPQTAQHNVSLAQGAGFGRRADPGDGHSMAGGIGLLVDGAGDDTYRCGVFGQGVGYWYGYGGLIDFGGDDSYDGVWYVQGSAAHYALGCLLDLGGDDAYLARMNQSQGQGHDYSIGLLHDFAGSNSFTCQGGGALGSGRWNGIGLFAVTGRGPNRYAPGGDSYGSVSDHRPNEPCFGLFADTGRALPPGAAPFFVPGDKPWFQLRQLTPPLEIGAGWAARSAKPPRPPSPAGVPAP